MEHSLVTYPAIVEQGAQQTRVHFPDLPAADVVDADYYQALMRAQLGLAIVIIDLESHHEPVPAPSEPTTLASLLNTPEARIELITTDLDEY
ncbi:hypothetical protein [Limosilactobacillus ingluviei]|uniref:hypothetical protein n=1 Tax=Limosilactobacillus ingluviei TaxID=148604 RepID=UPI00031880A1|nr:hypothetical protein [Limosilactobacillus ingluviei]